MLFQQTLYRAVIAHNRTGLWPRIVGAYGDDSQVVVRRTEHESDEYANGAFVVIVREAPIGEDFYIADGLDEVKRYLRVRDLHVTRADWTVERGHTP